MIDVLSNKEARKDAESQAKACQIQCARDCFQLIRSSIRSTLERDVHGWVWALEQMATGMETETCLASDVKAWKQVIEAYDAFFELV